MRFFYIAISLIALQACKRGNEDSNVYIFGGDSVQSSDSLFASNVSIGKIDTENKLYESFCSGVIISEHAVLTSAECFDGKEKQVFIRAAGSDKKIPSSAIVIQKTERNNEPHLAYLAFDAPIASPQSVVKLGSTQNDNQQAWIYALGQNKNGEFGELRKFSVTVRKSSSDLLSASGSLATGDSGGGLFIENGANSELIGIVSDEGSEQEPRTHFTAVQSHTLWIECASSQIRALHDSEFFASADCPASDIYGL